MRRDGKTFLQIGDEIGVTETRAWQLVTEELRRLDDETKETAAEIRRSELLRLDKMLADLSDECSDWTKTNAAGVPLPLLAMPKALSVMERRAKLLGLDAKTPGDEALEKLVDRISVTVREVEK